MAVKSKKYVVKPKPGSEAAAHYVAEAKPATLVTQKARGIVELSKIVNRGSGHFSIPEYVILTDDGLAIRNGIALPVFARPCPECPRHGFKDSCICKTLEDVKKLWAETKAIDPKAEMVLMKPIKADFNAVWTNGLLTIGPGHDGATSGIKSVVVPTLNKPPIPGPYASIKESAFFEFVTSHDNIFVVQLRDGPMVPHTIDYVAKRTTVREVVRAEGDLLEWETRAKEFTPGTVVWHPMGSLASHYAIHCMLNGVPLMISREPKVGEVLEATAEHKGKLDERGLYRGFFTALRGDFDRRQAGLVMLSGLHNYAAMDLSVRQHAIWFGAAMGFAIRMGFLASIGEARYAGLLGHVKPTREQVYTDHWDKFQEMADLIASAQSLFLNYKGWSGGIGGPKWANCTHAILNLWSVMYHGAGWNNKKRVQFAKDAVSALNVVVNSAHNNGTYLNKFLNGSDFDMAADNPTITAMLAMKTLYRLSLPETHAAVPPIRFFKINVPEKAKLPEEPKPKTLKVLKVSTKPVGPKVPAVPTDWTGTTAHAAVWPSTIHVQYKMPVHQMGGAGYLTHDFVKDHGVVEAIVSSENKDTSYAGTTKPYAILDVAKDGTLTIKSSNGLTLVVGKLPEPETD